MQTSEGVKKEKITHLEYCLEKLLYKDNGYNEEEIKRLYTLIYRVICEMKRLDATNATKHFTNCINDDVRKALRCFNIELVV